MRINVKQAAEIISVDEQQMIFIAQVENRIPYHVKMDDDIIYHEDGTVSFKEGNRDPIWEFELEDVLTLKKQMEEELVGEIEENLNDDEL